MIRPRKHRIWTDEEKCSICLQRQAHGVSAALVARRYAMNANLIFKWPNDPRYAPDGVAFDPKTFLPVEINTESPDEKVRLIEGTAAVRREHIRRLEIILSDGVRLKVEGSFDGVLRTLTLVV